MLQSWLRFWYWCKTNLLIIEPVKIEAKRTLLILHLRIQAKWILFITQIQSNEAERTRFIPQIGQINKAKSVYSTNWKEQSKAKSVYSTNSKNQSEANSANSRNRQDRSEKNELNQSKTNRGGLFKTFMEPRNRFQGTDSVSLCPGGPVQQPYSSLVPGPLRLF